MPRILPIRYQYILVPAVALWLVHDAIAFDVNGFKDGMAKSAVKELATQHFSSLYWNESEQAYCGSNLSGETICFAFCGDILVEIKRVLSSQPTMFNAIAYMEEQIKERGTPTIVSTESHLVPSNIGGLNTGGGQSRVLKFEWIRGREKTTLRIISFDKPMPPKTQDAVGLGIVYSVANSCDKNPK